MKTKHTSIFVVLVMTLSMATSLPDSINSAPHNTSVILGEGKVDAFVTHVWNDDAFNGEIRLVLSGNAGPYQIGYSKFDSSTIALRNRLQDFLNQNLSNNVENNLRALDQIRIDNALGLSKFSIVNNVVTIIP